VLDEVHLIVAKHRNGPTGDVSLLFHRALAKFENAAKYTVDLQNI
jgi:replicative DNA helicase